jgi:hypothetical protein
LTVAAFGSTARKRRNGLRVDPAAEADDHPAKAAEGARLVADLAAQVGSIVVADDRPPAQHQLRPPIVATVVVVIVIAVVIAIAVIGEADAREVHHATSAMIGAEAVAIAAVEAPREPAQQPRADADVVAADVVPGAAAKVGTDRPTTTSTILTIDQKGTVAGPSPLRAAPAGAPHPLPAAHAALVVSVSDRFDDPG